MSTQSTLREQCAEVIDTLDIPQPFTLTSLVAGVARQTGKHIELVPIHWGTSAPCGALVATDDVDYVYFDAHTSNIHQIQIIFHELGHMLLGHTNHKLDHSSSNERRDVDVVLQRLMPNLSPALIRRLGRSLYEDEQERAAELFASILMGQVTRSSLRKSVQLDAVTPLWTLLVEVIPDIVLTWDDEERGDDVEVLCRRVIEIRDAQLRLRSYVTSEMQSKLESILSFDRSRRQRTLPIWEAAELTVAIAAVLDGRDRQRSATSASPIEQGLDRDWSLGHRDLVAEAEWLGQVAQAMRDPRMQAIRRLT